MTVKHKRPALWLLLAALVAAPLFSQSPPAKDAITLAQATTQAIRVETRVVLVDVVVTDRKGESIPALRQEDFSISEDGKPQTISAFEEHQRETSAPVSLPAVLPNVYTNIQPVKSGDSVNVLLIDLLNTQPWFQKDVCNQAIKYLKTVPEGTRLAIFTLNTEQLRLARGFATDSSELSASLDDKSGVMSESSWLNPTPSRNAAELKGLESMIKMQASPVAVGAVKEYLGREVAERAGDRTELTLQAFQHLARYLSGIPARKNVIWFADSFPISFVPENKIHTPNHQQYVQQTSDMLTAAQVAIYPVSAHGLEGDPTFQVSDMLGNTRESMLYNQSTSQIAMETIAEETGGRAFYNTNGLDAAMGKAIDEGSHYYTLAYAPTNAKNDSKYRRIEIKVPHRDYRLSYRRGYYADKPAVHPINETTADDPLIPLVGFGMPNFDQITYQIHAAPLQPQPAPSAPRAGLNTDLKAPLTRYGVDIAASLKDFALETAANGARRGRLEAMLVAYDRAGKIVNISKLNSRFAIPSRDFAQVQANGFPLHLEIDVPPGDIYLRTGIYDWASGNAGTLGMPLSSAVSGPPPPK